MDLSSGSLYAAFQRAARAWPEHAFVAVPASASARWNRGEAFQLCYDDALEQVEKLAERYRSRGYVAGHRVALLLENRPEFLLHYFALNAAGASVVPLNPDYRPAELAYVLGHSEAVLGVSLPGYADRLAAAGCAPVVTLDAFDELPEARVRPCRAAAGQVAGERAETAECAVLYTSGTTGRPKGCVLSNAYCLAMGMHYISEGGLCAVHEACERLITPLPLFHMNALVVSTMAMVLTGGCIVQLDRFHPATWWHDVAASGATILHYLGVMPALLLAQPPGEWESRHRVRFGFGANANPRDHQAFEARFGIPLVEAWAMTETGSGATIAASREPRHPGTRCIGRPRAGLEIRLVDAGGEDVPEGQAGEALVRRAGSEPRAGFFSGYLKDRQATEDAWRGGWFHTGDVMRRGADGQYHFVDRSKNIIRRSGENIAALEVEAALLDHPAIRQIAVLAAPDDMRDEEVLACIVLQPGCRASRETAVSVQDWSLERLAYFKAPGYVVFVEVLPVTATNKVQKIQLAGFAADPLANEHSFDLRARKKRTA